MNRPSCSPRHRRHCSPDHLWLVQAYRDQRDARDALRESGTVVDASMSHGANAAAYQLEDADFDQAYPRVTFKDWLIGNAGRNSQADLDVEAAS